jgi:hypothetical protein
MQKITATELALADLYRMLAPGAADGWLEDSRRGSEILDEQLRDPWAT